MAKLTGEFATRRDAELAVERLVQEFGVARDQVTVAPAGEENTAGEKRAGSDVSDQTPNPTTPGDPALAGKIAVTVQVEDEAAATKVKEALAFTA